MAFHLACDARAMSLGAGVTGANVHEGQTEGLLQRLVLLPPTAERAVVTVEERSMATGASGWGLREAADAGAGPASP